MLDQTILEEFLKSDKNPLSVHATGGGGGSADGNSLINFGINTAGKGAGSAKGFTFFDCTGGIKPYDNIFHFGYGDGAAIGNCSSRAHCKAVGSVNGYYFAEFEGHKVYLIDNVPTCLTAVYKASDYMYAEGFLINDSMYKENCFVAKVNGEFAHDVTLRLAVLTAFEKYHKTIPLADRVKSFIKEFPNLNDKVDNCRLFVFHNKLTNSCTLGRKKFMHEHGIDINGSMTVEDFINLTAYEYNGKVIRELGKQYGMKFDHL